MLPLLFVFSSLFSLSLSTTNLAPYTPFTRNVHKTLPQYELHLPVNSTSNPNIAQITGITQQIRDISVTLNGDENKGACRSTSQHIDHKPDIVQYESVPLRKVQTGVFIVGSILIDSLPMLIQVISDGTINFLSIANNQFKQMFTPVSLNTTFTQCILIPKPIKQNTTSNYIFILSQSVGFGVEYSRLGVKVYTLQNYVPFTDKPYGGAIIDKYLYLAAGTAGLLVFEISTNNYYLTRNNVIRVSSRLSSLIDPDIRDVHFDPNIGLLYIIDYITGLYTVKIVDPTAPLLDQVIINLGLTYTTMLSGTKDSLVIVSDSIDQRTSSSRFNKNFIYEVIMRWDSLQYLINKFWSVDYNVIDVAVSENSKMAVVIIHGGIHQLFRLGQLQHYQQTDLFTSSWQYPTLQTVHFISSQDKTGALVVKTTQNLVSINQLRVASSALSCTVTEEATQLLHLKINTNCGVEGSYDTINICHYEQDLIIRPNFIVLSLESWRVVVIVCIPIIAVLLVVLGFSVWRHRQQGRKNEYLFTEVQKLKGQLHNLSHTDMIEQTMMDKHESKLGFMSESKSNSVEGEERTQI